MDANEHRTLIFPKWLPIERGFFRLLFGWGTREAAPVGAIVYDEASIRLESNYGTAIVVPWQRPFVTQVSVFRDREGQAELNIGLRAKAASVSSPWLLFRVMWPGARVSVELPVKQEYAPFIAPDAFAPLWESLNAIASAHGAPLPRGIDTDAVTDEELEGLRSLGQTRVCIACSSSAISSLAPRVYRCNACGYEGGEGLALLLEARRYSTFDAMSDAERWASAREDIVNASRLLTAAPGELTRVVDKKRVINPNGHGCVMEARTHLQDAVTKDPALKEELDPVLNELAVLDRGHLANNLPRAVRRAEALLNEAIVRLRARRG